jgi:hypothetical protein
MPPPPVSVPLNTGSGDRRVEVSGSATNWGQTQAAGIVDEYLVDPGRARLDVRYAIRAVVVHVTEDWPGGRYCRNCKAVAPCGLCQWGARVLEAAGWRGEDVLDLVRRAEAGEVPWS